VGEEAAGLDIWRTGLEAVFKMWRFLFPPKIFRQKLMDIRNESLLSLLVLNVETFGENFELEMIE
jgi:hypothetical protein